MRNFETNSLGSSWFSRPFQILITNPVFKKLAGQFECRIYHNISFRLSSILSSDLRDKNKAFRGISTIHLIDKKAVPKKNTKGIIQDSGVVFLIRTSFLFWGSIRKAVLYVNEILTAKCGVGCRCLSSGVNCI